MSIEQYGDTLRFACDSCGEFEEFHRDIEFKDAWAQLTRSGWRARKIGNEWVHACDRCKI